ncbi:hypothetical protein RJD24_18030 [Bacillaceae bacterium IKA-2]|nr:hypothetical protein RJD24_18030 [Bacillaceae bacterium IKA-2]
MFQVIVLIFTIFAGWLIFDFVKHKKFNKENVFTAFITALIAGVAYYVLYWLF